MKDNICSSYKYSAGLKEKVYTYSSARIVTVKAKVKKLCQKVIKQLKKDGCIQNSELCIGSKELWLKGVFLKVFLECSKMQVLFQIGPESCLTGRWSADSYHSRSQQPYGQ